MLGAVPMPKRRNNGGVLPTSRLAPFLLPLLFTIIVVAIGIVTWRFYVTQKEVFDRGLHAQLATTADAKVRQLEEWRRSRLGQARVIASGRSGDSKRCSTASETNCSTGSAKTVSLPQPPNWVEQM